IDGNFLKDVALDSILLSPYVDLIQIETTPALPPENRLGLLYRIGHAMAQNQKAVWALGAFCSNYSRPLNHDKVNLTVLVIAEAYAHGAIKELDLSGSPEFTPIAGTVVHPVTLSVPRRIQAIVDFIWSYRDLLTGFKPYAKIAVVYSVPTFLWATFPAFNLYPEEQRGELIGIADMLQKLHLPYEVLIFGHPDLFNDSYYLGKLEQYDLVILPHVTHISEDQLNAIENFLEAGGKIVFTGGLPTRDHEHNPLTGRTAERMAALLNKHPGRVLLVDEKIGLDWFYGSKDRTLLLTSFQKILETAIGRLPIKLEGAADSVEVSLLKKQGVTALHLINYQYELENDSFKQLRNISVLIDESLIGEARNAFYISPELVQRLEISRKGSYLEITVPFLSCWGFIAFNLPPRLKVYELTATPSEVAVGETATITVKVQNDGGEPSSFPVTLRINNVNVETRTVFLSPGEAAIINFTYTPVKEGRLLIEAGDLSTTLNVLAGAKFAISNLQVTPQSTRIGEPVTIAVTVRNTGGRSGSTTITFVVNGSAAGDVSVELAAGAYKTVNLTYTPDKEGVYIVKVEDQTAFFIAIGGKPQPEQEHEQPAEEYKHTTRLMLTIIAAALLTIALTIITLTILAKRREKLRRPSLGGKASHQNSSQLPFPGSRSAR
ncbi:MAG: CARDB domain-containing protein, partial [Thermofilum sp.]